MSAAKTTIIAVLVLVLTFSAGVVVGVGVARFTHMTRGPRGPMPHIILNRLDRHLDLTDAQEAEIREIFRRRHGRMTEEIERTNREIEAVLTPEQRTRFQQLRMRFAGHRR